MSIYDLEDDRSVNTVTARFIIGNMIVMYTAMRDEALKPKILFRILQAMYTIQARIQAPMYLSAQDIREQIIKQFSKKYSVRAIERAMVVLESRGAAAFRHGNRWLITRIGKKLTETLFEEASRIAEYEAFVQKTSSPNLQPPPKPHKPLTVQMHLTLVT